MTKVKTGLETQQLEVLDVLRSAGNSIRLEIIELLSVTAMNVTELQQRLGIKQPSVSRHLRILLDTGLIVRKSSGNHNYYSLRARPFRLLQQFSKEIVSRL